MKTLQVVEFELQVRDDWLDFKEGGRLVLQRADTEVIVSVYGSGGAAVPPDGVLNELESMAVRAARNAAEHPDLEAAGEGHRDERVWSLATTTRDRLTFFAQLVIRGRSSVLLLTFESKNDQARCAEFAELRARALTSAVIALRSADPRDLAGP
jgi:hypothetical protein